MVGVLIYKISNFKLLGETRVNRCGIPHTYDMFYLNNLVFLIGLDFY